MSEQRPPGDNDGSRTAQRRRRAAWRFRRRQNAIQAATEHDARVTALIARAVQQQVDQEGFLPSAERDARVATLTVGVVHARLATLAFPRDERVQPRKGMRQRRGAPRA
ncbi:hypothetical protein N7517_000144 [Penicillium concentricum]|uniref:Uncharacterized protein n=1 Tax=Penicillium concentricum TaxID=293559 RepID=A0A9W9SPF2_9EURO|nr:uncharacterized protein N7517_000144 [Penicillium concentricum]KAJ5382233.1 hypothetical protein N7517_000144 [Penicillium concentricum]